MLTQFTAGIGRLRMQKIEKMPGPTMRKRAGRAVLLAGMILTLLQCVPAGAQQGRDGRATDQSLPVVQQAFKMTDARFLISFSRYCMLDGPNSANGKGDAATPSQLFDNLYYVGKTDVGAWALKTSDGLVVFDTLSKKLPLMQPNNLMRLCALWRLPRSSFAGCATRDRCTGHNSCL